MRTNSSAAVLATLLALLTGFAGVACTNKKSSAAAPAPTPLVTVSAPAALVVGDPGDDVEIRYSIEGVDSALVDVVAQVLYGEGADLLLAAAVTTPAGAEQVLTWDSTGVELGLYRIQVQAAANGKSARANAPGLVRLGTLSPPPGVVTVQGDSFPPRRTELASGPDGALALLLQYSNFGESLTFGAGGPNQTSISNGVDAADLAIARYAPEGEFSWVRTTASPSSLAFGRSSSSVLGGALVREVTPRGAVPQADGSTVVLATLLGDAMFDATAVQGDPFVGTLVLWGLDANGDTAWLRTLSPVPADAFASQMTSALDAGRFALTTQIQGGLGQALVLGQGEPNETSILNGDVAGEVLAVYESNGQLAWAQALPRRSGGTSAAHIEALAQAPNGDLIVTGWFFGSVVFGLPGPGETLLTAPGAEQRVFVARVDQDGELVWIKVAAAPATMFTWPQHLAVAANGSIALVGVRYYDGALTFDAGLPSQTVFGAGGDDGTQFLVQFDSEGLVEWALDTGIGDEGAGFSDQLGGLIRASNGDWIVAGSYRDATDYGGSLTIDPNGPAPVTLEIAPGSRNLVLMRFTSDGALRWARLDGAANSNYGSARLTSRANRAFSVACTVQGGTTFGQGDEHAVTTEPNDLVVIATYGPNGELLPAH